MGGQAAPKEKGSIAEAAEAEAVAAAADRQTDRQPGHRVSEATKDIIRARLLCLSEAGTDAELIEKVAEAPIVGSKAAQVKDGADDHDDHYRSKLMAMSDTLPEVENLCKRPTSSLA